MSKQLITYLTQVIKDGSMLPITAHKLKVKKQVSEMKYSLEMKKLE